MKFWIFLLILFGLTHAGTYVRYGCSIHTTSMSTCTCGGTRWHLKTTYEPTATYTYSDTSTTLTPTYYSGTTTSVSTSRKSTEKTGSSYYILNYYTECAGCTLTGYWCGDNPVYITTTYYQTLIPQPRVTITEPWTGSTIATTSSARTNPSETLTIIVEIPVSTVTTTVPWVGTVASTTTVPATGISGIVTLVIETPEPRITTTEPYIGSNVEITTIFPSNMNETITVLIETPIPTLTTTVPWIGTESTTETVFASDVSGTATVIVKTPESRITTTKQYTGSDVETTTIFPSNMNETITVLIDTPIPTLTTTIPWTGTEIITHTVSASNIDGTALIVVESPEPRVTTTETYTGSDVKTTTIIPSNSNETIIVLVDTPISTKKSTIPESASDKLSTSIFPSNNSDVISITSTPSVASTISWTGSETSISTIESLNTGSAAIVEVLVPETIETISSQSPWQNTTSSKYVPSEDLSETIKQMSTTDITITSCSDNRCFDETITTGLTTVINEFSSYVTFCPLSKITYPNNGVVDGKATETITETNSIFQSSTESITENNNETTTPDAGYDIISNSELKNPVETSTEYLTSDSPVTETSSSIDASIVPNIMSNSNSGFSLKFSYETLFICLSMIIF